MKEETPNFDTQEEAEKYYEEEGWNIIHPKLVRDTSKCNHVWEKQADRDYQCGKCLQGYIGVPDGI